MVSASPLTRSSHHAGDDFAQAASGARGIIALEFSAMPQFTTKRRVRHSAADMFDLVADVERYPEFVPLCQALKVRQRTPKPDGVEIVIADMTVSFKLVRETFTQPRHARPAEAANPGRISAGPVQQHAEPLDLQAETARTPARSGSSSTTNSGAACWRC